MTSDLAEKIRTEMGQSALRIRRQAGGSVSTVYNVEMADGNLIIAKVDRTDPKKLELEAWMLGFLKQESQLPVPEVLYSGEGFLFLEHLHGRSTFSPEAQRHAAEILAALHGCRGPAFGFELSTLIGSLHQPNPWTTSWIEFFGTYRLYLMAVEAYKEGVLPTKTLRRIDELCPKLDSRLIEPAYPALIHGDAWAGNILSYQGRISGFLDPAIYYANPEIELAFTTLFGTFGRDFFDRYHEIQPIEPGFFEERKDIYNLYPLLVHVRLFAGGYVDQVETILTRSGF